MTAVADHGIIIFRRARTGEANRPADNTLVTAIATVYAAANATRCLLA